MQTKGFKMEKKVILTGDRTTGPLHLGHFVGSLQHRVVLQDQHDQYIMLADLQALTDNMDNPARIRSFVSEVVLDYLSVGIDPEKSTIFVQSLIPEIAELTLLYLNLVTVNRLKRNPTVKTEINQKGYGENVTAGFLVYPVHQAADITIVQADIIPVGADQLPMIEQANELVRSFNHMYKTNVLKEVTALVPEKGARLVGIDGKNKMGKSLGNAIFLSDSADQVVKKVMSMYTDPLHVHVQDPGQVEGNAVFAYLDIFDKNHEEVASLKQHYMRGGLGDVVLKKRLISLLNDLLEPIRIKRAQYAKDPLYITSIIHQGSQKVKERAAHVMKAIKEAMYLNY